MEIHLNRLPGSVLAGAGGVGIAAGGVCKPNHAYSAVRELPGKRRATCRQHVCICDHALITCQRKLCKNDVGAGKWVG